MKACTKKLFIYAVRNTLKLLKKEKRDNLNNAVKLAQKAVNMNFKGKRRVNKLKVIPVPNWCISSINSNFNSIMRVGRSS